MTQSESCRQPDVSIVIPAKNEAENIIPLITEIRAAMDEHVNYELIYVDDGSTDATWATLLQLQADGFDRLRLIKRLLDQGHRPGKLISASPDEFAALAARAAPRRDVAASGPRGSAGAAGTTRVERTR